MTEIKPAYETKDTGLPFYLRADISQGALIKLKDDLAYSREQLSRLQKDLEVCRALLEHKQEECERLRMENDDLKARKK